MPINPNIYNAVVHRMVEKPNVDPVVTKRYYKNITQASVKRIFNQFAKYATSYGWVVVPHRYKIVLAESYFYGNVRIK
jgi:hypothetical protein